MKLFPEHFPDDAPMHLRQVLSYRGTRTVVLERHPAARKCSLDHAEKTGDWGISPAHHLKKKAPCQDDAPLDFVEEHNAWFRLVRNLLSDNNLPRMEIPFEAAIKETDAVRSQVYEFAGLALNRDAQKVETSVPTSSHDVEWAPIVHQPTLIGWPGRPEQKASFIAIHSDSHSGSAALSLGFARRDACAYECHQFFGRGMGSKCEHLVSEQRWSERWSEPLQVMQEVHHKICNKTCSFKCRIVFELFPGHYQDLSRATDLLIDHRMRNILLERNPADRWCSKVWSEIHKDWGPSCPRRAPLDFEGPHREWFRQVRKLLAEHDTQRLEVPFESAWRNTSDVIARMYEFAALA